MAYKLLLTATLKQSGKNKCAVEGWGHSIFVYPLPHTNVFPLVKKTMGSN